MSWFATISEKSRAWPAVLGCNYPALPDRQELVRLGRLCAIAAGFVWSAMAGSGLQHAVSQTTLSESAGGVTLQLGWNELAADSKVIKLLSEGEWKCKSMARNAGVNGAS